MHPFYFPLAIIRDRGTPLETSTELGGNQSTKAKTRTSLSFFFISFPYSSIFQPLFNTTQVQVITANSLRERERELVLRDARMGGTPARNAD